MVLMLLLRPTTFARRAALPPLARLHAPRSAHTVTALRAFSSNAPTPPVGEAPAVQDEKKKQAEEPLTNKKIWDQVLSNHPEQHDRTNGDLLYEYSRKSYFGILSAGSLAHIAFWSWFKGYEQSLIEMLPQVEAEAGSFFSFVTNDLGSSIGFGSSIMLAFLIGFHAKRSVARISVVGAGDKLRITTHKFFGNLGEPFDVPAAYVSANPNMKKNMILKVGKDSGFYLVDINGHFYNRKKLESMITFRTDYSDHDKMIEAKETIKIVTDLPRTNLKDTNQSKPSLPKRIPFNHQAKNKGNLLGRKPTKPKAKK